MRCARRKVVHRRITAAADERAATGLYVRKDAEEILESAREAFRGSVIFFDAGCLAGSFCGGETCRRMPQSKPVDPIG